VVRTRTAPAGPGQRMRMAATDRSAASVIGPLSPDAHAPAGASRPAGQADTRMRDRKDGPAAPGGRATASVRQPREG